MSNQLAIYEGDGFEMMTRAAKAMALSGYFQDSKDISQAMVKVMAGAELGIAPFAAMSGIAIIKGKPSLGASLMAGIVKNDPRYDYRVVKHDDTVCQIQFYERGHSGQFEKSGISTFTAKDAARAGTQNMSKFPKNMLFARAMSNGFKWYCAGAGGGMPVYSDGELDTPQIVTSTPRAATVDEETGVIDGEFDGYDYEEVEPPFVPETFDTAPDDVPMEETAVPPKQVSQDVGLIISDLQDKAKKSDKPASAAQVKLMMSTLGELCDSEKMKRSIMMFIFNIASGNDATGGMASAIIEWGGLKKDNGWKATPESMSQARVVYKAALIHEGQLELL